MQGTLPTSIVTIPPAASLAGKILRSLSQLQVVPGLTLELTGPQGTDAILRGKALQNVAERIARFPINGVPDSQVRLCAPDGPSFELAELAITSVLDRMEVERREELLLDELGANRESLEVLYEISTDVLGFGDVKAALKRLIERFVSLQDGLRACLILGRQGRLESIVSNYDGPTHFDWPDLGPVEAPVREGRPTVIANAPAWETASRAVPWHTATTLAAAPLTSRQQKVIGLLMVWREDRRVDFGASFSRLLEAIAYQASMLLASDRLNRTIRENERLAQEIEIASSIQQTLLMGNPPVGVPMVEIDVRSAASQHIDGDFHDFLKHGNVVDVLIGDVMGKGVAAALLGAATKSQFLRAIANLALRGKTPSPVEIVRRAASRLSKRLIAVERFVTLCYARFDPARGLLEFVDCGHTGILLHRKRTGETRFLRGDDLPLGVSPVIELTQCSATIMPGDTFLLFSDGVTETKNQAQELFGEERLIDALETWSSLGPTVLLNQIKKLAEEFRGSEPQSDDFTCLALRVVPEIRGQIPVSSAAEFLCDLDQLEEVRKWLRDLGERAGVGAERQTRLETASQEAFVNCFRHGSPGECSHPVLLDAEVFSTQLRIRIRHKGPAFDPLSVPPPSFDGSRECGFGTFIIMRSADELEYQRVGEMNIITLSVFRGSE